MIATPSFRAIWAVRTFSRGAIRRSELVKLSGLDTTNAVISIHVFLCYLLLGLNVPWRHVVCNQKESLR